MRSLVVVFAAVLVAAGCGSSESSQSSGSSAEATSTAASSARARPGSLQAILDRPGPDVVLEAGTSDYAPGSLRVSFLVIDKQGRSTLRPRANVWVASALDAKPFARTAATLEPVGIPGASEAAFGDVTELYVTRFSVPKPGTYFLVTQPVGGRAIQGVLQLEVKKETVAPAVGARAIPSRTPTIASAHGNLAALTTATPPDTSLLRYSVADSLAAHRPFVLAFATPKFCASRTCGPVVDVLEAVRKRFTRTDIRFIHVEIYKDNNPSLGTNRWVKEWRLPSEPFVFLVGRDGRIKVRFEGSVSERELAAAVRRNLAA